jgi:aspartate beta-hydroxylase
MDRCDYVRRVMTRQQPSLRSPHPLQRPMVYCPDLGERPWYDTAGLEWTRTLEAHHDVIRQELLRLRTRGDGFQTYRQPTAFYPRNPVLHDAGDWSVFYFYFEDKRYEDNCARCPETARLLAEIPRATGLACFSALAPGTHITPHCGPFNMTLRAHLGLVVPADCAMRVGDETRAWEEGKCAVFDDTFEHEVWNRSAETRFVLMFDVYHPRLSDAEVDGLRALWRTDEARGMLQPWWDVIEEGTRSHTSI